MHFQIITPAQCKQEFLSPEFLNSQGFSPTLPERLFSKIVEMGTDGEESHLIWKGGCNEDGYGRIKVNNSRVMGVHQVMWIFCNGPRDPLQNILHTCDVPPCCKPEHLYQGTRSQNMQDMWDRSRHGSTAGVQNGRAILTPEKVTLIRASTERRKLLAQQFGVSLPTVDAIKVGRIWKHLI